jgi:hypothetical protein
VGDLGWDFTSNIGISEVEMRHVCKPTKLRWNCGVIEIVVSEIEFLEMAKREKGAIGMDGTLKATATEVDADHMTCHLITRDPIPPTTICAVFPIIHLRIIGHSIFFTNITSIRNGKGVLELEQSRGLI